MKPVIVVENSTEKLIKESVGSSPSATGANEYRMGGVFTEFGVKNRNQRIYTAEGFLPALNEFSERIAESGGVYGELDHPDIFDVSMTKATHLVEGVNYVPELNRVEGKIRIIPSTYGNSVRNLIDTNCPIFVSSRAAGLTESNGNVIIKKLFTYDIVAEPGFANAKMTPINESLGYGNNDNTNFRIYEISDESKINEFFKMNNNDEKTNMQLIQYSEHLQEELAKTQKSLNESIAKGDLDRAELSKLISNYEELQLANEKMTKYLSHIHETVTVVMGENKALKKQNEELSTKIDNTQAYTEFVENKLQNQAELSNLAFDKLDASIAYSGKLKGYLEETMNKTEDISGILEKNTLYIQHLGDVSDSNFVEISEELKGNASYFKHLSENLNRSINLQGAIVEKLNGSAILEGKQDLLPTLESFGFVSYNDNEEGWDEELVKLKAKLKALSDINTEEAVNLTREILDDIAAIESAKILSEDEVDEVQFIPEPEVQEEDILEAVQAIEDVIEDEIKSEDEIVASEVVEFEDDEVAQNIEGDDEIEFVDDHEIESNEDGIENEEEPTIQEEVASIVNDFAELAAELAELVSDNLDTDEVEEDNIEIDEITMDLEADLADIEDIEDKNEETIGFQNMDELLGESKKSLTDSISDLIEVAKKQKVTNTNECRFLHFLNKNQIENFNNLTKEDQETAKLYISERSYYSTADVLRLIQESLSNADETQEERVLRLMPTDISDKWESLTESTKKSVIAQSSLIQNLNTETQVENFWYTRSFVKDNPVTKTVISEEKPVFENKLSQDEFDNIMSRLKGLNS